MELWRFSGYDLILLFSVSCIVSSLEASIIPFGIEI